MLDCDLQINPQEKETIGEIAMSDDYEKSILDVINSLESDLQRRALWLRGEQAYKEYPGFSINRVREAKKQIKDLKNEV